jgi:hypothetical protein
LDAAFRQVFRALSTLGKHRRAGKRCDGIFAPLTLEPVKWPTFFYVEPQKVHQMVDPVEQGNQRRGFASRLLLPFGAACDNSFRIAPEGSSVALRPRLHAAPVSRDDSEPSYGSILRTIPLPAGIDSNNADAMSRTAC